MKLKATELREPLKVEIRGDESWLDFIYDSFGRKRAEAGPLLTGQFTVTPREYGVFAVEGRLNYSPKVACGRCEDPIDWVIDRPIDVRFLTPPNAEELGLEEGEELETDLEPEDLDSYYTEDGVIDIEQVINDIVQTALPQRLVKATPDGKACAICLADLQDRVVYEDKQAKDISPFAVLKNLKLPRD